MRVGKEGFEKWAKKSWKSGKGGSLMVGKGQDGHVAAIVGSFFGCFLTASPSIHRTRKTLVLRNTVLAKSLHFKVFVLNKTENGAQSFWKPFFKKTDSVVSNYRAFFLIF